MLKAQESVPALGHEWGAWSVTKPATLKKTGAEARSCQNTGCTQTQTRELARLTSKTVKVKGVSYLCDGKTAVVVGAGKKLKKAAVPATVKADGVKHPVTDIAAGAFKGCKALKSVTIGTKKLTKRAIKGSLKGSSVEKVVRQGRRREEVQEALHREGMREEGREGRRVEEGSEIAASVNPEDPRLSAGPRAWHVRSSASPGPGGNARDMGRDRVPPLRVLGGPPVLTRCHRRAVAMGSNKFDPYVCSDLPKRYPMRPQIQDRLSHNTAYRLATISLSLARSLTSGWVRARSKFSISMSRLAGWSGCSFILT